MAVTMDLKISNYFQQKNLGFANKISEKKVFLNFWENKFFQKTHEQNSETHHLKNKKRPFDHCLRSIILKIQSSDLNF